MTFTSIKSLKEFYNYIDANVFNHADAIKLDIDIKTLNDSNKYRINLITDCLKYTIQTGKAIPLFTDSNGNCYPNISILNENDIHYLSEYIDISANIYIKAKLNHLIFIISKCNNKINFAESAIDDYIELFEKYNNEQNDKWSEMAYVFDNLTDLVFKVNYKINEIKLLSVNIVQHSNQKVLIRNAAEFLIKKVQKKKFNKEVLSGFVKIFKHHIKKSKENINWIENFIILGRKVSKIQNGNLIQWDLLQAKAYENEMKNIQKRNNQEMLVASWCKDAIKYYKKAKNEKKANSLFKQYNNLCKNINYASIKTPAYNLQDDIKKIENYINNANNIDVLHQLIYGFIPNFNNNKVSAEKIISDFHLTSSFSTVYSDIYGQAVGYADTDEEKFKYQLWNIYSFNFHFYSIILFKYIQYALKLNKLSANLVLEHLKTTWLGEKRKKHLSNNQIIEYQWLEHIEEIIISYFDKQYKYIQDSNYRLKYINEVDSITLKIEGILRDLVDIAHIQNFQVRKFSEDAKGRQISNWKSINELLWNSNIFNILSEDDVWFMRYLLTDWLNLRNNIAHCLIHNPYQEQYYYGFQWLLIIVLRLSMYLQSNNK